MTNTSTTTTGYKIPFDPDFPRSSEYSAGSPGDYRPIAERLADRIMAESDGVNFDGATRQALVRAFSAGRAFEADGGNE